MAIKEKEINIIALEFPDNVRTRPGMYVGATDTPGVILREAIDNSVDELMGSISCNKIDVQLKSGKSGGWYVIADNGRGIPIKLDPEKGITKTELAVGSLNAGSKFIKSEGEVSVGLNGVGISCTNALSDRFVIISKITHENARTSIPDAEALYNQSAVINEPFYVLEFKKGIKVFESAMLRNDIIEHYGFEFPEGMSTVTAFIPDPNIWDSCKAKYDTDSLAYVKIIMDKFYNKECEIKIDGEVVENTFTPFKFDFTSIISVWDPTVGRNREAKFYVNFEVDKNLSTQDSSGSINSLIVDRGIHIDWTKNAYREALRSHYNIQHDYLLPGLKINVICLTANMDFSSQTKERCVKIDSLTPNEVIGPLMKEFHKIFDANESYFKEHVERLQELADAVTRISAINKVKAAVGTIDGGNRVRSKLPSSVKDAASNDRKKCELFIIEGKSASGTMLKSRNPEIHATLELRGVPLNAINLDLDTIMDNPEMCGIVTAIGYGVNEYHNLENCRYGKVILAADADIDGSRINSMILGFIAKKMTGLLQDGRVYVALAPLYHQGNKYVYPGENPEDIIDMSKPFRRYKGLGEVNTKEAYEFFFDENKRRLIQVQPSNLSYVFELLTFSSRRKELMIESDVITDKYGTGVY